MAGLDGAVGAGLGLEVRLLGPVEVVQGGSPLHLGGPRQRALLAVLALRANEVVPVERLVQSLFGLDAPDSATNAVQVAVSRLRRQLAPGVLETRGSGYLLALEPDQLDVSRLERLLADGRERLRNGNPDAAAAVLRDALELFRGEPLSDLAAEEFAQGEVRRLEALRLEALTERIESDLASGRGADLVAELQALVAEHPLHERLRGQLMLALYRAGRQSDALDEYRSARTLLREELGLKPSRSLQELEVAILQHDPALDARPVPASAHGDVVACPFKGLAAFTLDDGDIFFGRARVVDTLVAHLAAGTFVGLVGASGTGKSSVLQAGLLRALQGGALPGSELWATALLRPGDPVPEPAGRIVVAVDQLEELFTTPLTEQERLAFLDALVRLALDPSRRALVAVALRADFYGRCAAYSDFAALLSANHVLLGAMKRDELAAAIAGPAARAGLQVEQGLVQALVADVEGEPGALPLLSSALLELWQEREGNLLTASSYRLLGGVHGAIGRLAESAYARLADRDRESARLLLLRLATEEDGAVVRRRVPLEEIGADAAVLRALADARLVTVSENMVEVSHEALLREWPRLRDWLDEDREGRRVRAHLAASARDWAARGRNPDDLYRGPRLVAALEWAQAKPGDPTVLEHEFLAESRAERGRELARQRRRNRQLLALLAGAVVLLLAASVAGAVALAQRRDARRAATAALAGQVGAEAVSQPRIDLAMLLAAEAVRLHDSPQTEGTLLATLLRSPAVIGEISAPIDSRPQRLVVSPDGKTVAVSDNRNTVRLYDTTTRRERGTLTDAGFTDPVVYLGSGARFAAYADGAVDIFDTRTLRKLRRLREDPVAAHAQVEGTPLVADHDGTAIYSGYTVDRSDGSSGPGYVDRWNARGRLNYARTGANGVGLIGLSKDGARLVAVGKRTVTIFDAQTLRRIRMTPISGDVFALSPDARTVAATALGDGVELVDLSSGHARLLAGTNPTTLSAGTFSPDGSLLATAADDGTVTVWNVASGRLVDRFTGHANRIFGIAFAANDRTLWTCSLDGAIFSWDIGDTRRFGVRFSLPRGTPDRGGDLDQEPAIAVNGDGTRFAARSGVTDVQLLATSDGRALNHLAIPQGAAGLAYDPAAPMLAVVGANGLVETWAVSGVPHVVRRFAGLGSVNGQPETVETVAFSPDGKLLAAGDVNHTPGATPYRLGTVAVWDVASGRRKWLVRNRGGWAHKLAFSPDGRTVAVAQEDGVVRTYDATHGRLEHTYALYGGARDNRFSYDTLALGPNDELATGVYTGIAQLWSTKTGHELATPHLVAAAPVASLAVDPTAPLLASVGGSDGTVKLSNLPALDSFGAAFPLEAGQWGTAAFTPDGSHLIVLFSDGRGDIWPTTRAAWLRHACAVAGRNLTREEWGRYLGTTPYEKTCPGPR